VRAASQTGASPDIHYVPTPNDVVDAMLQVAMVTSSDVVYDLGSGDGRIVILAAQKYAATGGWGYSSFDKDGKPTDDSVMQKCFPCHQAVKERDFVFTRYSP